MAANAVTVALGDMADRARARIAAGSYASMSEVVRAGLRALDREEQAIDDVLRAKVAEALADPRPPLAADEAFEQVRAATRAR